MRRRINNHEEHAFLAHILARPALPSRARAASQLLAGSSQTTNNAKILNKTGQIMQDNGGQRSDMLQDMIGYDTPRFVSVFCLFVCLRLLWYCAVWGWRYVGVTGLGGEECDVWHSDGMALVCKRVKRYANYTQLFFMIYVVILCTYLHWVLFVRYASYVATQLSRHTFIIFFQEYL